MIPFYFELFQFFPTHSTLKLSKHCKTILSTWHKKEIKKVAKNSKIWGKGGKHEKKVC